MRFLQVSKNFTGVKADLASCDPDELVMMVDVDRCIACGSCLLACQQENGAPDSERTMAALLMPAPSGTASPRQVNLPSSCRGCDTPCEYFNEYNFWATCPVGRTPLAQDLACDQCQTRIAKGFMPACATRCSMKCIYFGRASDVAFTLAEKRLRDMGDVEIGA